MFLEQQMARHGSGTSREHWLEAVDGHELAAEDQVRRVEPPYRGLQRV